MGKPDQPRNPDGTWKARSTELSTDVSWTGRRYTSVRDGVTVVNVQTEPVGGTAAAVGVAQRAAGAATG